MGGDKETERGLKPPDWAKESGDKFYSLTEESDLTSGEHSLSESGSSMSSETGNISSSNEPTVRQLRQQRKCTKTRIAAVEVDVDALREQCVTQDGQLTDIMWKLEDYENRQKRNNLRFLGIDEVLEGSDIRAYMIKLLRGAFSRNWLTGTGKLRSSVFIGFWQFDGRAGTQQNLNILELF
ncbi:hypothetical protein NDU88_001331 [Pleurodeles waltl]|uniref:Uncharacterized protein n=1 Tax=Pleurodeles waltl TaxID=8319 RepID=A0AAV7WP02_PLEWA|nr:hypothetical protein NDU88_001331 [Pleurodeles waltl]